MMNIKIGLKVCCKNLDNVPISVSVRLTEKGTTYRMRPFSVMPQWQISTRLKLLY